MAEKKLPARILGMEQAYLDGSESMPSSKFCLAFDQLKHRIAEEEFAYSSQELKEAHALVKLADSLMLLYVSQDTPLYYTQNSTAVNMLADELVLRFQQAMTPEELPPGERAVHKALYDELIATLAKRNELLRDYVTAERFMRSVEYSSRFSTSCLLGMSMRVRRALEHLAAFNRAITERFNLMSTNVGADNVYKVGYVLEHIGQLQRQHQAAFPVQHARRRGDYQTVLRTNFVDEQAPDEVELA